MIKHHVVVTDFGVVTLSDKTNGFLYGLDEDWEDLLTNKKRRGKNAKRIRAKVKQIENAVILLSEMAFDAGEDFEKF
jgi:hypothetical protein